MIWAIFGFVALLGVLSLFFPSKPPPKPDHDEQMRGVILDAHEQDKADDQ